jgi:hypothetical protein
MAASKSIDVTWDGMAQYIDGFAGISVAMIGLQLVFSLMGLPFDGRWLPLRTPFAILS